MWATYCYDDMPRVIVTISGSIESDQDFKYFIQEWISLFECGESYNLEFNTINCGLINIKYAILMAYWIKRLKRRRFQNLESSKIIVANRSILHLLRLIFYIERPIAPVEVIYKSNNTDKETIERFFP
tara:strand:- start:1854 stop:2237 length:384 start_codon:yes stop_codon:yes gene_type:complete